MTSFSTKTRLREPRRNWAATLRSCRVRRMAGVRRMGWRECSSQTGHLNDRWRGASVLARHRNPFKAAQDVLFFLVVCAHALSLHPQHRPHVPRRYLRQTYCPRYQRMDVPPPRANAGKDCSRVWTYDCTARWNRLRRWLARYAVVCAISSASEDRWDHLTQQPPSPATLGEKSHTEFMFGGGIEMGTRSFFDAVGCSDDKFRVSANLGGVLCTGIRYQFNYFRCQRSIRDSRKYYMWTKLTHTDSTR